MYGTLTILLSVACTALEAQAIGRVYRLGQRNSVKIIKFYMENTIETRLLKVINKKYGAKEAEDENAEDGDGDDAETVAAKDEDGDKKMPAIAVATSSAQSNAPEAAVTDVQLTSTSAVIGHMKNDRGNLLEEEFDYLFGVCGNLSTTGF